jgi:hypothetical protein
MGVDVLNHLLTQLRATDQLPHYLTLPPEGSPERAFITPYLQAWKKSLLTFPDKFF